MKKRIINAPVPDTLAMLKRRVPPDFRKRLDEMSVDAVGLVMLPIPDLYYFADLASKSANVLVSEITGTCPQHVTTLGIFGEIAAVSEAMQVIDDDSNG